MKTLLAASTLFAQVAIAQAACPQELAIYEAADGQSAVEFVANSSAMAMRHEVRIVLADDLAMTGYVGVSGEPIQPVLFLPHECPEGDVTGEELAQCVVYDSVIYAIDDTGTVGDLPIRGEEAAQILLLPNFIQSLVARGERFEAEAIDSASDVYQLSGCQE